jgi:hypothetical protein
MPTERFQDKHALRQDDRQHDDHYIAAIAGIEESTSRLGVFFMVLYQIVDDQVGVDKPSLAHREPSRARAASAGFQRRTSVSPSCWRAHP